MSADAAAAAATVRAPRGERTEGRRGGGARTEREPRPAAPAADAAIPAAQSFVDTLPGAAADAAAGAGDPAEREASRRRRRRGGRGRGRDEGSGEVVGLAADASPHSDHAAEFTPSADEPVVTQAPYAAEHEPAESSREAGPAAMPAPVAPLMPAPVVAVTPVTPVAAVAPVAPARPAPGVAAVAATPAAPYRLPTDTLAAIATDVGLQWVNSDSEKIRAVQEAMANEPKPIHAPRQPKPTAVVDDGPLVLVETKKDLSQVRLPFDSPPPTAP